MQPPPPDPKHESDALALGAGSILGPFRIVSVLGRGGMGVVYRAYDERLRREVALKAIAAFADAEAQERFVREGRAAARLRHPGIVAVYGAEVHEGTPVIMLELVEGTSLASELSAHGPLQPERAARLLHDLALAVQAAHEEGVVHRDLKPGNVLLDREGRPRLTDFGLARDERATAITMTGATFGSPAYMAPEQALGHNQAVGPRTDVYGLGGVLYHALTGSPPFDGTSGLAILRRVIEEDVPPPSRARVARGLGPIPADLETICLRCLEKSPERRYPNAAALAKDLARYLEGDAIEARRVGLVEGAWRRVQRRPVVAVAVVAVVATAAVSVGLTWREAASQARLERRAQLAVLEKTADEAVARFDRVCASKRVAYDLEVRAEMLGEIVIPGIDAMLATGRHAEAVKGLGAEGDRAAARAGLVAWRVGTVARDLMAWELAVSAFETAHRLGRGEAAAALREATHASRRTAVMMPRLQACYMDIMIAREANNLALARAFATQAIALDESRPESWLLRAQTYAASGRQDQLADALRDGAKAAELRPTFGEAHRFVGSVHTRLGHHDEAKAAFTRAIELRPNDMTLYLLRAQCFIALGDREGAWSDAEQATRAGHMMGYLFRGQLAYERGDLALAYEDATRVITVLPAHSAAWVLRGMVRAKRDEVDAGLADVSHALDDPECPTAARIDGLLVRAAILRAKKDVPRAIADCEEFLKLAPDDRRADSVRRAIAELR